MTSTWLVTGASRGIGLELAGELARRGERVIATVRRPEARAALEGVDARVELLDVAEPASVAALAAALDGEALDVLVNNAGTYTRRGLEDEDLFAAMGHDFETNTLGALRLVRALLPNLRAGGERLVCNVTSKMGSIEDNTSGGSYPYRASKAALNMVTRSLAHDLAPEGFRCVVVHPGWVQTDMGGQHAPLPVGESVAGLLRVLAGLGPEDSGRFFAYDGAPIPW